MLRCERVISEMTSLPTLPEQAERLAELGVHRLAGWSEKRLRAIADTTAAPGSLLAIHPDLVAASALTPLLSLSGKRGFLVVDMPDVDEFVPMVELPDSPVYLVDGLDRGDAMANWSPEEADPAIAAANRTPLTLTEGMHWLLQRPETLERGRCFMTIGSRKPKPGGKLDARTPALWISNGTGRDGAGNENAPKVGWCWAGNRHTWLGFASAAGRRAVGEVG
ncbi:MAG: hypothetical protein JWP55_1746 [Mycobacterium sp.]|nr:hypothetical protein [Mycobacterium sp.]